MDFSLAGGTAIMRAYTNLLMSSGKWRQDEGNALDRKHFISGSTLFAFQLEPDFSHHGEYLSLVKNGNVRLEVQFSPGLSGTSCYRTSFVQRALKRNVNISVFMNGPIQSVDGSESHSYNLLL